MGARHADIAECRLVGLYSPRLPPAPGQGPTTNPIVSTAELVWPWAPGKPTPGRAFRGDSSAPYLVRWWLVKRSDRCGLVGGRGQTISVVLFSLWN